MSDIVPITIPMTIESTETTVQMDMQDVVAPVQIDFTASAVTLPAGSDATVEYAQKHFTFGIPRGEGGSGGGAVDSVNGMTGDVVLDAEDVGALPNSTVIPTKTSDLTNDSGFVDASGAASASPVQSVNGKTGTVNLTASDVGAGTYSKPAGGIPKTDLASGVQTSLGKADTAYQKPSGGVPSTDLASAVQTSLGKADSAYQKPSGGIPSTDMSSAIQTSLGKADTALQSVPSTYRTASAQDAIDATLIPKPSSPATGAFLVWSGTAWVAQTLSVWQGGSF